MPEDSRIPVSRLRIQDSLISRLLLMGLVLFALGAVSRYYVLTRFLREDLSRVVESQQMAMASYVAHDVDDKIVQRTALLERLAASLPPGMLEQPDRLRAWLKERYDYQTLFPSGLFVLDRDGKTLADFPVFPERAHLNYSDRDYVRRALQGQTAIGRPALGRATKVPILPIAVPVKTRGNAVRAILVGITPLGSVDFLDRLLRSPEGQGGFLVVSPRDRLFVASSRSDMVLKPTPPPGVNPLHDRAMAGYRGAGITHNADGVEEVSAIASVPSAGWFVVARVPASEAFATVGRMQAFLLRHMAIVILVFCLLASAGMYWVLRPLFQAAHHAEAMTRGEGPLKPIPVLRNDEVGHFISAFNRLLAKLDVQQAELAHMAHHDVLTGLPNRALLAGRLKQALALARRERSRLALLFMDLDGFKQINDTLGHEAGDEALRQVARRLEGVVRASDTLARVGGDEFVLLLCDLGAEAPQAAAAVADKCIAALRDTLDIAGHDCRLGISVGIALGDGDSSADALLLAADRAMYQQKKSVRG
jgi:diguanylate cyclase (GGDEF)-like protein